jgi:PDZ domain-containing protein
VILLLIAVLAGFWIRLPYYTISPGGSLPVESRISVAGARTYTPHGSIRLLYVRERARVNVWRYVQAKLDPNIDLFKEKDFLQGTTPEFQQAVAENDMATAQINAEKVALERIGYKVQLATRGVVVTATIPHTPADGVLQKNDVVLAVDGTPVTPRSDLSVAIRKHRVGDRVTLSVRRGGKDRTVVLRTQAGDKGKPMIGVFVYPVYRFPVKISIDTSDIGGPSAGLAMTLAIVDELTPGDLTGGKQIAVTGTISPDARVGEIGGIEQKAVTAHAAHAALFIVPKCIDTDLRLRQGCLADLARARKRVGDMPVIPVSNLTEALDALRKAGGAPVTSVRAAA